MTMAKSEFPAYIDEVIQLREEYAGRIDIRLGVESDYITRDGWTDTNQFTPDTRSITSLVPSTTSKTGTSSTGGDGRRRTFTLYIQLVQEAVRCGAFDIVGHLDAVKGLGVAPADPLTELWDETVRLIAAADLLYDWKAVTDYLYAIGVRQLATFRNRRREMVPLSR